MISSLYLDRLVQRWAWTAHNTLWEIVKASVQVKMSFFSTCLRFDEETTSIPSRNICGSCSSVRGFTDNKSANSTNWPPTILDTNFEGTGACPGPTIKAFSDLSNANEDSRLGRLLVTPDETKVEGVGATRRAELERIMADTGVNLGTNTGRLNVPYATEETPLLVLVLGADAEESKGCGAPLEETSGTEEETCEGALLWIGETIRNGVSDCSKYSLGEGVS